MGMPRRLYKPGGASLFWLQSHLMYRLGCDPCGLVVGDLLVGDLEVAEHVPVAEVVAGQRSPHLLAVARRRRACAREHEASTQQANAHQRVRDAHQLDQGVELPGWVGFVATKFGIGVAQHTASLCLVADSQAAVRVHVEQHQRVHAARQCGQHGVLAKRVFGVGVGRDVAPLTVMPPRVVEVPMRRHEVLARVLGVSLVLRVAFTSQGQTNGLLVMRCRQVALAVSHLVVIADLDRFGKRRIAELDCLEHSVELVQYDTTHLQCHRVLGGILGVRSCELEVP